MKGLNTADRKLSSMRGKPLIINVWASWCGPCVAEMGSLERMVWHEAMEGVHTIGVSTDDYRDRALALLRRTGGGIPHYIDRELELEELLGASTIPLTVLIDASGVVLDRVRGARAWDSEETIRSVVRTFKLPSAPPQKNVPRAKELPTLPKR